MRRPARRRTLAALALALAGPALAALAAAGERDAPRIVDVAAPARVRIGEAAEVRLVYRAPGGNVVAVVQVVEDADGPALTRSSRVRELSVVARAFGFEQGQLAVPIVFATAGLKRVTLTLVTDEREESEPAVVEIDVSP